MFKQDHCSQQIAQQLDMSQVYNKHSQQPAKRVKESMVTFQMMPSMNNFTTLHFQFHNLK